MRQDMYRTTKVEQNTTIRLSLNNVLTEFLVFGTLMSFNVSKPLRTLVQGKISN